MLLLLKLMFAVSVVLMSAAACDTRDSNEPVDPEYRPEIPLNAPADIVGVWGHCNPASENKSSSGTYIFTEAGGLFFRSMSYQNADCQGDGVELFVLEGQYAVGANNTLDMSLGKGNVQSKLYRVFSVQANRLTISNNISVGASAEKRDWALGPNALVLTKLVF